MKEGSRIKDRPDIPYKEDAHAAAGNNGSSQGNTRDATKKGGLHDRLARESGPPVLIGARGRIQINQNYFVARFCLEHLVLFEQDEGRFYLYSEANGAWHKVSQDVIKELLRSDWKKLAPEFGSTRLLVMGNEVLFNALTSGVRSFSGCTGVFKRLPLGLLHVANGMLKIRSDGKCELLDFSPNFYSRNPIPLPFNSAAECPRFRKMLDQQLGGEDADLFIRWCGSALLEGNHAQRLVLMEGVQHSSKTTLINVLEGIVGLHNSTALRTSHLDDRFEIGRFAGKTLLTAKDVRGDFLQHPSAQVIKRLSAMIIYQVKSNTPWAISRSGETSEWPSPATKPFSFACEVKMMSEPGVEE